MSQEGNDLRIESKLQSRENSTLMFATVAGSASLLIFALLWQKSGNLQIPDWVDMLGFVFSILWPLYREITIFTIDRTDHNRLQRNWTYALWDTVPRFVIVRLFLYLPVDAWLIWFIGPSYLSLVIAATIVFAIIISIRERLIRKRDRTMSEKTLSKTDAKKLSEHVMQTRFTWAVVFLAFFTGLVGLLSVSLNVEASMKSAFGLVIYIVYKGLSAGLSYSFYALCQSSFLVTYLISKYEDEAVKSFLKQHWSRSYASFFSVTKNGEVTFRKWSVIAGATIIWILSILLLLLKP